MNKESFLENISRLLFWKYKRSEINAIIDDFSEYIDIAVENGEKEADVINRLGSPKNFVNEPDIQTGRNSGTMRKIAAIVLLLYFFICLVAGNSNPYFLTSITFCIVFPLLLLFVLGGEISSVPSVKLTKRFYIIFGLFPIFMFFCWLISFMALIYVSKPWITDFKKFLINNFGNILTFLVRFELVVGIAILLILIHLYLKHQYNIYNASTIWAGVISSMLLQKHYFMDLSSSNKVLYHMLISLTPFLFCMAIVVISHFTSRKVTRHGCTNKKGSH